MNNAVCAIIFNESGQLLATHRRDDNNDWGLPGGKVDPGEPGLTAIIREVIEETGIETTYSYIRTRPDGIYQVACYFGSTPGIKQVTDDHEGLGAWVDPKLVLTGSFGEFNRSLFSAAGLYQYL